jgi:transglutaminase/protease-like cytokinesis protein 3
VAKGLVKVQFSGDTSKKVKVLVDLNGTQHIYIIRNNDPNFVPLQMGNGTYKISVLQNVAGNKYKPLVSQSVEVKDVDVNTMYTSPSLLIDYSMTMEAVKAYLNMTKGAERNDAIQKIYEDLVKGYSYDFDKVNQLPADYVPVIDQVYKDKKGICYDYSALLASALRSQGVPTKLVMGYAPDVKEYHAWNEILIDGKWVVVDTTYDSQMEKGGAAYTFAKDGAKRKVVKVY